MLRRRRAGWIRCRRNNMVGVSCSRTLTIIELHNGKQIRVAKTRASQGKIHPPLAGRVCRPPVKKFRTLGDQLCRPSSQERAFRAAFDQLGLGTDADRQRFCNLGSQWASPDERHFSIRFDIGINLVSPEGTDAKLQLLEEIKVKGCTFDVVRRQYLAKLYKITGSRNVVPGYLGDIPEFGIPGMQVNDADKNGFTVIHGLDRTKGPDPVHPRRGDSGHRVAGGSTLHLDVGMNIRAIVPQLAMSAGTTIACSQSRSSWASSRVLDPLTLSWDRCWLLRGGRVQARRR